ncbi:MAG: transcriptional regulator [Cyanobacteria bacterium]|nr:transcriptional regulator [Cyanobacteriota bacterium]MDW8200059.1 transcriptional regulator [Cyanobacteriota bacterium SKYGB_h_bin112]
MTPNLVPCDDAVKLIGQSLRQGQHSFLDCSAANLDMLKRDRFELLSAYLDSEVTAAERRQVEELLAHDPVTQCLYKRLLKLRQGMRAMPCVETCQSSNQLMEQVLACTYRRTRRLLAWGGFAVVLLLASVASLQLGNRKLIPQVAEAPATETKMVTRYLKVEPSPTVPDNALVIALNRPVLEIPVVNSTSSRLQLKSEPTTKPAAAHE